MGPGDRSLLPFACASPNKVWLELVLSTGASVYIYAGASSHYSDISIIDSCQFNAPLDLLQGSTCPAWKASVKITTGWKATFVKSFFNYYHAIIYLSISSNSCPTLRNSPARGLMFWIIPPTQPCVFLKCQDAAGEVAWTTAAEAPRRLRRSRHSKSQQLQWQSHMLPADRDSHIACLVPRRFPALL